MVDDTVRVERDLYLRLLELGTCGDLAKLLEEALELIIEVTRAEKGYLALYDGDGVGEEPRFAIVKGLRPEEISGVRRTVSTGVVAAALSTGRTIATDSAIDDPRFSDNRSVQLASIGAVLCSPIGGDGVIYLQHSIGQRFDDHDRVRAETFTRHLAPFVDRLSKRSAYEHRSDPTAPLRQRMRLDGIIGRSTALAAVLVEVEGAARFDVSVLLRGPTGTGKAALAHTIHDNSARAAKPFVTIDCSAMPEPLFETELFGGQSLGRRTPGLLAAAEGGTIFLDEIGELGLSVQGKLLQLLQARQYYPVGATTPERADVRLIAATSTDLEAAVREKRLREDLYYRLVVLVIAVPDLEARDGDVGPLARHFCALACAKHKLPTLTLSTAAMRAIEAAEWPGNLRQLAHAIETAAIRAAVAKAAVIEIRHVFGAARPEGSGAPPTYQEATRKFQKQLLQKTLEDTGWNVTEAARRLGLSRAHVHNLITTFELDT